MQAARRRSFFEPRCEHGRHRGQTDAFPQIGGLPAMYAGYRQRPRNFGGPLPIPLCARDLASAYRALLLAMPFMHELRLLPMGNTCGRKE